MAHTPGPWFGEKDSGVKTAAGGDVFETGCGCCTNSHLSEDDARLIAAAPDLLAACKLARQWMDDRRDAAEIVPAILEIDKATLKAEKTDAKG